MYNSNNNSGYGNGGGYGGGGYGNSNNNGFGGGNNNAGGYGRNNNNGFGGGNNNAGGYGNNNNNGFGNNTGGYGNNNGGGYGSNNNNGFGGGSNNNNNNYQQQNYSIDMPADNFGGNDGDVTNTPEYQATTRNIQQITVAVTTLTKLVQQLGTSKDSLEIREKIRSCVESTTHLISAESSKVKTLTSLANKARDPKTKLLYQKLAKEYNNCLQQFKDIAQVATKKERSTPLPQSSQQQQQQQQHQTSSNSSQYRNNNNGNGYYNNQQQYYDEDKEDESQSLMEASRRQQLAQIESEREYQNSIIQEREEGIRQIEQSIVEINEIFMDLSNMVSEQGVMLNTIEYSLESTVMNTQEGVEQIKKASEHQRSARTKMCWLALILFIVAGVLAKY
ncbi:syntaxin 7 [Heterostelium album PN500]|uniref:Syntaxin 7 n=1 Tax=Heterostelium pallidum (strain ATCC 26659 / Pp 5 / PN500) TaxID=670386 RepID=D3BSZ3_HETP5|nr:syntaxin 7 [Heterostelium album PN500]EFA75608.1 syntaxin 7 [Heterostelium album PN500]|eukprot:XP_020427742.1 syntaxin 7 [Heterostelium album PN500]